LYCAGPITKNVDGDTPHFIEVGRGIAEELRKRGWSVVLPHTNSFLIPGWTLDDYLAEDFEIILRCNAVVLLPNWHNSKGTRAEIDFASARGIPIYDFKTLLPDHRA
jgi:nucleoside 2-deoxyribosyltransferase